MWETNVDLYGYCEMRLLPQNWYLCLCYLRTRETDEAIPCECNIGSIKSFSKCEHYHKTGDQPLASPLLLKTHRFLLSNATRKCITGMCNREYYNTGKRCRCICHSINSNTMLVWGAAILTRAHQVLIVNWNPRNKRNRNVNQNTKFFNHENASENNVCEMAAIKSRERLVKYEKGRRKYTKEEERQKQQQ